MKSLALSRSYKWVRVDNFEYLFDEFGQVFNGPEGDNPDPRRRSGGAIVRKASEPPLPPKGQNDGGDQ